MRSQIRKSVPMVALAVVSANWQRTVALGGHV